MLKQIIAITATLGMAALQADPTIQDLMIQDIESIKYNVSIKYAPKEWKNEYLGWTLDKSAQDAKDYIVQHQPATPKEFQKVLKRFLSSVQDYHVKPVFYSTEWAFFPIGVKGIQGHYYLTINGSLNLSAEDALFISDMDQIDNIDQYDQALSNLEVGDEVIALDGLPIKEVIEKIIDEELGGNRTPTGYALAEKSVFCRMGRYGDTIPKGVFQISVRHMHNNSPGTYQLPWIHVPEWIMNKSLAIKDCGQNRLDSLLEKYLKRDFTVHFAEDLLAASKKGSHLQKEMKNRYSSETDDEEEMDFREKGDIPELGEIVWESSHDQDLYAYLYKNRKGQKIGYIYLPHFSYVGEGAEDALNNLIDVLKYFNKESAGLVLDIRNNPGGNVIYMYAVLATLTNAPLVVPNHKEILTQEDVYNAALLYKILEIELSDPDLEMEGQTFSGYPCTMDLLKGLKDYARKIIDNWEAGKVLSDPLYLIGLEQIMPHPEVQYTKPLLVLINELDFSCGDLFPAILQDNHRGVLFGKGTAGAGGFVRGYQHSSRFGVMGYTLTGSVAYRPDGNVIENLGVTPDVPYDLSRNDATDNFIEYTRAVNRAVDNLVN